VGRLPIKLIAPLTDWKEYFAPNMWHVRIVPSATNGLTKESAVDTLQLRGRNGAKWCQACLQMANGANGKWCPNGARHKWQMVPGMLI
jgi:mRNA interferase MazF